MTNASDVWGLKRVGTNACRLSGPAAEIKASRKGSDETGSGVVFAAFDRAWPLVGLILALLAIVWWKILSRPSGDHSGLRGKSHPLHACA
jgi:hypothetical protein